MEWAQAADHAGSGYIPSSFAVTVVAFHYYTSWAGRKAGEEPAVVVVAVVAVVGTTVAAQPNGILAITFLPLTSPTLFHPSTP